MGTERLLDAISRFRTKRLVNIGSFSAYDFIAIRGQLAEDTPLEANLYERDGYAIAKTWQERVVRRMSQKYGWDLTILRSRMI